MLRRTFIKIMAGAAAAVYAIGVDLAKGRDRGVGVTPEGKAYPLTPDLMRVMNREHLLAKTPPAHALVFWADDWQWRLNPADFAELIRNIEADHGPLEPYSEVRFRGVLVIVEPMLPGGPLLLLNGEPWRTARALTVQWRNWTATYSDNARSIEAGRRQLVQDHRRAAYALRSRAGA